MTSSLPSWESSVSIPLFSVNSSRISFSLFIPSCSGAGFIVLSVERMLSIPSFRFSVTFLTISPAFFASFSMISLTASSCIMLPASVCPTSSWIFCASVFLSSICDRYRSCSPYSLPALSLAARSSARSRSSSLACCRTPRSWVCFFARRNTSRHIRLVSTYSVSTPDSMPRKAGTAAKTGRAFQSSVYADTIS